MKKILLPLFIFSAMNCFGQAGMWTWISGANTLGSPGVFGTQGVPSVNNHPPGLYEYCEWKDKQGNFWVYGGWDPSYSDLWKYDPLSNEWTWVKGTGFTNQVPVYGTQGVPNPANTPGTRESAAATWVDTVGNLWLFGGALQGNDLWEYLIATNEWIFMNGTTYASAPGVYGIKGFPDPANVPCGRLETCSAWTDALNNLWLFGGTGVAAHGGGGFLNDLWKYDIAANEWTWMNGSDSAYALGSYGIMGVAGVNNSPCGRLSYTKWKDLQDNFWLLGGCVNFGVLNDLWKYDLNTNEWTWMAGPDFLNDAGVYTSNCVFDSTNFPAARVEHRSAVTDNCGRFWLFGGYFSLTSIYLNDLWAFDPAQLKWNWISGTNVGNQGGSYGTLGVSSSSNMPPSRWGAVSWWGNDNRFYLFGGSQNGTNSNYSDLWVYTPDSNCISNCNAVPVASFTAPNHICSGTCTSFLNFSTNAASYQWSFFGATPPTSTDVNPTNICYSSSGSYDVQLIATNANGSDTLLLTNYITVYPAPPAQAISQSGDTLFAIAGATSYQWFFNGNIINGATDYFYIAPASGDYNVVATDENGCEVEAAIFNVIAAVSNGSIQEEEITIFPNPVEDKFTMHYSLPIAIGITIGTAVEISIYNVLGEQISAVHLPAASSLLPTCSINVSTLPSGLYYLEINSAGKTFRTKFVKT